MIWPGAFSTLLQLWAHDMPGSNMHGGIILRFLLTMATSAHWSLSVSRRTTLQGHLNHSSRRKLQLALVVQMSWKQGFQSQAPTSSLQFLGKKLFGLWELGAWENEGQRGILGHERNWWQICVNWSCQLDQQEIRSMNLRGREWITVHKDSLKFRPGSEL